MDVLVTTNEDRGETVSNRNDDQTIFTTNAPREEGSVVILRTNPLILPMVCGICGNQYAVARGKPI